MLVEDRSHFLFRTGNNGTEDKDEGGGMLVGSPHLFWPPRLGGGGTEGGGWCANIALQDRGYDEPKCTRGGGVWNCAGEI